jgi:hypothetical protein
MDEIKKYAFLVETFSFFVGYTAEKKYEQATKTQQLLHQRKQP